MKEEINYGDLIGTMTPDDTYFDNSEDFTSRDLLSYKIIKQRIYLGYLEGKKAILGIGTTFKNLLNGKIEDTVHKVDLQVEEIEELIIEDNDYLTKVFIQLNPSDWSISFIRFITHKNNQIFAGEYEDNNEDRDLNNVNEVIIGFYGGLSKKLGCLGCLYISKDIYNKNLFFGIFLLKYWARKDKSFRDKWNKSFKELDIPSQYIWKVVNLPDNCEYSYHLIIKFLNPL